MNKAMLRRILDLTEAGGPAEEVADGVFETRRRLLWMPFAAAALMIANRLPILTQTPPDAKNSEWTEFLETCLPTASELHADGSRAGQERYLRWLSYAASKLELADLPPAKLGKFKDLDPAAFFGVGYRGKPFFVVEWRFEPNAYLPPHNHPNVSVCTVGLEGEARIRNFEPVADLPEFSSSNTFQVRETHNEIIKPGRINTLSSLRDNIHTFKAGKEGARGIDITTYHGENIGFSHLRIQEKPIHQDRRIFEANWLKL